MKNIIISFIFSVLFVHSAFADWTQIATVPHNYISDIEIQNDTIYLSMLGSGVLRSTDNMQSWETLMNGLDSLHSRSVYSLLVDGSNFLIATEDGIYKSTNNGQNWVRSSNGIFVGNGAWYAFTESIQRIGDNLLTGAYTGIYRSTDGGEHWIATNITGDHVGAKAFTTYNGDLYAARESINTPYAYKSTDGGLTWQNYNILNRPTITYLSEPSLLWCGTITGIYLSTDNGATWEHRSEGLGFDPYSSSIIRIHGTLVTSVKFGGSGIRISRNDGVLWEEFGQGLPFLSSIEELLVYGDIILAATSDGLYQRNIADVPTGIEISENDIPRIFTLSQNYPNPFNPSTTIEYALSEISQVNLEIFDILGREVVTLVNKEQNAGNYRIVFNASSLSGGTYFYRLKIGEQTLTRKATLLK